MSTRKNFLARVEWGKSTTSPPLNPTFIAELVSMEACGGNTCWLGDLPALWAPPKEL